MKRQKGIYADRKHETTEHGQKKISPQKGSHKKPKYYTISGLGKPKPKSFKLYRNNFGQKC